MTTMESGITAIKNLLMNPARPPAVPTASKNNTSTPSHSNPWNDEEHVKKDIHPASILYFHL